MSRSTVRPPIGAASGFTLIELIISMGITVAILGATMGTMTSVIKMNQSALLMTSMNNNLRTGMDMIVRDLLQVGQGLPTGGLILTPFGLNSTLIRLPAPPAAPVQTFNNVAGDTDISAVVPGAGLGPVINGIATDMITTLAADSAFDHMSLTQLDNGSMTVALVQPNGTASNIAVNGPDDVLAGQLIMLSKGTQTTLVQVTSVSGAQKVFFATGDSLNLNQPNAAGGSIKALLAAAPPDVLPALPASQYLPTTATRIRMISYYLDAVTVTDHPRLVRRMGNGSGAVGATTYNNTLGNVVAFDVENLQISYDLADTATNNPANVRMTVADMTGGAGGACLPNGPCSVNQIRKVNIILTGRSTETLQGQTGKFLRNSLASQISLRALAFVDRYRG